MRRPVVGVVLAAVAAGALGTEGSDEANAAQSLPACKASKPVPGAEKSLIKEINAERKRRGAQPLKRLNRLVKSARSHNRWMARTRKFSHPTTHLKFGRGNRASQNLAFMPTARGAFVGFMGSPPHKKNMLPKSWRKIGVGAMRCNGMLLFTVNMTV
ncbi:MAG: CAP domain-containing protein [Thermoleophilia bacterium]|nr:CAP domain-containing protein [Thermoleophilia bacterium]MDH3724625.1 CAP domain-containing protein [Thermoleophilia bacterium]